MYFWLKWSSYCYMFCEWVECAPEGLSKWMKHNFWAISNRNATCWSEHFSLHTRFPFATVKDTDFICLFRTCSNGKKYEKNLSALATDVMKDTWVVNYGITYFCWWHCIFNHFSSGCFGHLEVDVKIIFRLFFFILFFLSSCLWIAPLFVYIQTKHLFVMKLWYYLSQLGLKF